MLPADMVTVLLVDPVFPPLSVTVSVAAKLRVMVAVYVCVAATPVAESPSPKLHWYDTIAPSGSDEAEPSKSTSSGESPDEGVRVKLATGERLTAGGESSLGQLAASKRIPITTIASARRRDLIPSSFPDDHIL